MSNKIKVSVIIPCYNVEKYVGQCLDSVRGQTMPDLEIICVNDGSTDSTLDVLNKYAKQDSRIRIISQDNAGLSAARNAGLKYASGEYIAFLDSDDFVASDYYGSMYLRAQDMDADLVIGNDIWYWDDCQMQIGVTHYRNFADKKSVITKHHDKIRILSACAVWNKLYKRTLITDNNLEFYEGKHLEDMPFTFSAVALSRKIVFQPFSFLFYRQRNSSIMNNEVNRVRNAMDMLDNFSRLYGELSTAPNIVNRDFYKAALLEMIMRESLIHYGMLARTRPAQMQFWNALRGFIASLPGDECFINPFYRQVAKTMQNSTLNKLLGIKYNSYKIEFKLLGILPLMKIRWFEPARIKWLLFGVLPIRSVEDAGYIKWLNY